MRLAAFVVALLLSACCTPHRRNWPRPVYAPRLGLIHPLLDVDLGDDSPQLVGLKKKVQDEIESLKKDGSATMIAVNFSDVEHRARFGIDENARFHPASLFKLPMMIAFLKRNEADPSLLARQIALRAVAKEEFQPAYPPRKSLVVGLDYSIDELLRAMIARSDNNANFTLAVNLAEGDFTQVFKDMGLPPPDISNPDFSISPLEISTFFKILYQAGYLSWDLSQKSMEYLAASEFDDGLKAKLPPGVTVAHKFGEFGQPSDSEKQFHDCGFIYAPRGPYLLCVMTKGADKKRMAAAIAAISDLVYRELPDLSQRSMADPANAR